MILKKLIILLLILNLGCNSSKDLKLKNLVVILADDHALKATGCYGNSIVQTPNIDALARDGLLFNNAYCNAPICSASRASLLTGKYPHATGVNLLFTPFQDEKNITIAEHLREYGYKTALFGKTHFNNWMWRGLYKKQMPDHGFNEIVTKNTYEKWLSEKHYDLHLDSVYLLQRDAKDIALWMNSDALAYPIPDSLSEGTFYANQAIEFIESHTKHPFMVWLAFKEPHHPFYFPREFENKYDPDIIELPNGSPEDDRWVPEKFKRLNDEEKKGIVAAYYTSTEYLDKNIGLVINAIDKADLEDETIIIYLSDNGYLLYEHKRFEKHTLWEESVNQPLIIKSTGHNINNAQSNALVEYIDIVPTLLELLGAPPLQSTQGESFAHLLKNVDLTHRKYVFSEYLEDNAAMVRDSQWKYIFTTGRRDLGIGYKTGLGPTGLLHRLYRLNEDPTESKNLAYLPEYKIQLNRMQKLLLEKFKATHPEADFCPNNLSIEGQLVWFSEPRDVGTDQMMEDVPYRVFEEPY